MNSNVLFAARISVWRCASTSVSYTRANGFKYHLLQIFIITFVGFLQNFFWKKLIDLMYARVTSRFILRIIIKIKTNTI